MSKPDYALIRFKSSVSIGNAGTEEWDPKTGRDYAVSEEDGDLVFTPKNPIPVSEGPHKGRMLVIRVPASNIASITEFRDIPSKPAEGATKPGAPKAKAQEPTS